MLSEKTRRLKRTKTVARDGEGANMEDLLCQSREDQNLGERDTQTHILLRFCQVERRSTPLTPTRNRQRFAYPCWLEGQRELSKSCEMNRLPDVDADIQMRRLPNQRATKNRDNSGWLQEQHGTLRNKDGQIRWDGGDIYSDRLMRNFLRWTGSLQHPGQIKVPQMPQSTCKKVMGPEMLTRRIEIKKETSCRPDIRGVNEEQQQELIAGCDLCINRNGMDCPIWQTTVLFIES